MLRNISFILYIFIYIIQTTERRLIFDGCNVCRPKQTVFDDIFSVCMIYYVSFMLCNLICSFLWCTMKQITTIMFIFLTMTLIFTNQASPFSSRMDAQSLQKYDVWRCYVRNIGCKVKDKSKLVYRWFSTLACPDKTARWLF